MESTPEIAIIVERDQLPNVNQRCYDFQDSSFWGRGLRLPAPNDVRQLAALQNLPTGRVCVDGGREEYIIPPDEDLVWRRRPVVFQGMNLVVKWGGLVRREEAITLHALRKYFPRMPVPEVYAWRVDEDEVFIYMEHVRGRTLSSVFEEMTFSEHAQVIQGLRGIVDDLRLLKQAEKEEFIGSIVGTKVHDKALSYTPYHLRRGTGPFRNAAAFNDDFAQERSGECQDGFCPSILGVDPHRYELPDTVRVRFTHSDLQRSNVIVSVDRPYRVVAVVDWEEAGWMPEYWEVCKAHHAAVLTDKWSEMYLPQLLDLESVDESVRNAWDWFVRWIYLG